MTVEEKPDVTYKDVGGAKEQVDKLREVVEIPLLYVRLFSHWITTFNNFFLAWTLCKFGNWSSKRSFIIWSKLILIFFQNK